MDTAELSKYLIETIINDPKVNDAADSYARKEVNIDPDTDVTENLEYYRAFNEFVMVALGRTIVLLHPSI